METLISIILPTYNVEDYVGACIDSIAPQLNNLYELIVVDDGSTDSTISIIKDKVKEYNEQKIVVIEKDNGGVSSARNVGFCNSCGKYIIYMDSDDKMLPGSLRIMEGLIEEKNSDIIITGYDFLINNSKIEQTWTSNIRSFYIEDSDSVNLISKYLDYSNNERSWFPWAKVYKREIIEKYLLHYDESLVCCNDFDFVFRYLLCCRSLYFYPYSSVLYSVTRDGAITSSRKLKNIMSDCKSYYGVFKLVDELENSESKFHVLRYISSFYVYNLLSCHGFTKNEEKIFRHLINKQNKIYHYCKEPKFVIRRIVFAVFGFSKGAKILLDIHRRKHEN